MRTESAAPPAATEVDSDLARRAGRPLRVALFSKKKSRTLYTWYILLALERLGVRVFPVRMARLRRWFGRRIAEWLVRLRLLLVRPDLVLIFSGDISEGALRFAAARTRTALLLDDYFPVDDPLTDKIRAVDVFIHTMRGQLEEYRDAGVRRPVFIPSGVDPEYHRIVPPGQFYRSDLAFIGKAVYPERISLIRSLAADFDLALYGSGWEDHGLVPRLAEADVPHFRRICSSAHIVIGVDKAADRELYFSNRTWFTLGSGGFLLTRYVPCLEEMFVNHQHLVWFRDEEEARELIRWYLPRPRDRVKIAGAGHRFVHRYYPVDRMAREILRVALRGDEPSPLPDPREGEPAGGGPASGERPPGVPADAAGARRSP